MFLNGGRTNRVRNKLPTIVCIALSSIACVNLVACGNDDVHGENNNSVHDATKWFTEGELSEKGLAGLTAPIGLSGDMQSSDTWFNNGYSFSQFCPNEDAFRTNAETYFSYLKANYNGMFGKPRIEKFSMDTNENWYVIEPKRDLSDYFDDNPSKLYEFYYVRNNTLNDGYFIKGSVWIFEIRYELDANSDEYKFKLFIESADSSRNGIYRNYYKMR